MWRVGLDRLARWSFRSSLEQREPAVPEGMVRVVMLNDERARMDFVVDALSSVAGLARKDAVAVMMRAHLKGRAGLAILPPERATVMIDELASHARTSGQSLKCVMEKE